jgi:outer membrane murein-binding lipoprotein Lpp
VIVKPGAVTALLTVPPSKGVMDAALAAALASDVAALDAEVDALEADEDAAFA